ncbi:MAG: polyphenol oxidase family protein [Treponema sp.]|nr:polyphenol oxidase family protein [Treponema sp.]
MSAVRLYPLGLSFSGPVPYARLPLMMDGAAVEEISCVISSRLAGNMVYSPEGKNPCREEFYAALGLAGRPVFTCTQVHSRNVLAVDRHSPRVGPRGDGMISRDPELCLSVTVADCLPVYLYDTESGAFGLVHSGWRGTGIALAALRLMGERWGARPEAVGVLLGPCIQSCCYRVDQARAAEFEEEFGGCGDYPLGPVTEERPAPPGAPSEGSREFFINLPAANARLLAKAGVRNIAVCQDCTFTDERLGSFRREGQNYTRMAALIGRC